MSSELNMDQAF